MNNVIDALSSKVKSPFLGFYIFVFTFLNWRGFFLLATTKGNPQDRLLALDSETNILTLVVIPFSASLLITLITPWLRYSFTFISQKPFTLIDIMQLESEHTKIIRKTELEQARAALLAAKENDLISRAKRDEEISEIGDSESRDDLIAEIKELRKNELETSKALALILGEDPP